MKRSPLFASVQDLVLHRPPMLLLESIVAWDKLSIEALVNPADSWLFGDGEGAIPSWVGIEYMAQTISAFAGIEALERGEAPSIGFLLGTRKYRAHVASFAPGQKLRVKARELLRDETNLALFDCQIFAGEQLLASAEVKAIQPRDIATLINPNATEISQ